MNRTVPIIIIMVFLVSSTAGCCGPLQFMNQDEDLKYTITTEYRGDYFLRLPRLTGAQSFKDLKITKGKGTKENVESKFPVLNLSASGDITMKGTLDFYGPGSASPEGSYRDYQWSTATREDEDRGETDIMVFLSEEETNMTLDLTIRLVIDGDMCGRSAKFNSALNFNGTWTTLAGWDRVICF